MKASHLRPLETKFLLKSPHLPPLNIRKLLLLRISDAELGRNVKSIEGS